MRFVPILSIILIFGVTVGVAQDATSRPAGGGATTQPAGGTAPQPEKKEPTIDPEVAKALDAQESLIYQLAVNRCSFRGNVTLGAPGQSMTSDFEYDYDRSRPEGKQGAMKFTDTNVGMMAQQFNFSAASFDRLFIDKDWRKAFQGSSLSRAPDAEKFTVLVESDQPVGMKSFVIDDRHLTVSQKMLQPTMMGVQEMDFIIDWIQVGDKWAESKIGITMKDGTKVDITCGYGESGGHHVLTAYGFAVALPQGKISVEADISGYKFGAAVDAPEEKPEQEPAGEAETKPTSQPTSQPTSKPVGQ